MDLKDLPEWPDAPDSKWVMVKGIVYKATGDPGNYIPWVPETVKTRRLNLGGKK